jgi:hypothetical protein
MGRGDPGLFYCTPVPVLHFCYRVCLISANVARIAGEGSMGRIKIDICITAQCSIRIGELDSRASTCDRRGETMNAKHDNESVGISRRKFLAAIGTAAVFSSAPSILRVHDACAQQLQRARSTLGEDRFGRMFPKLPPFAVPSPQLDAALLELGKPGGILDAKDALDRGPVDLIVDPALSLNNPNSTAQTAGTTFMGQFMDHDMTFDLTSRLGLATNPEDSRNARTPALDLDSVYGGRADRAS